MKFLFAITLMSVSFLGSSQFIKDTVMMGEDSVVIFSDKSWEYINMLNFDGIVNAELHEIIKGDSNYLWKENWDTQVPYTRDNDLSKIPDTLWLCNVDSNHNKFCMPHPGLVTSRFKYRGRKFHYGIDVDLVTGDTLSSCFDGIVRYAKYNTGGYGNLVIIRHYNGLETYYAHLEKLFVSANQEVQAGEHIGLGGNTGHSTGDHLHFEIRLFGNALNPEEVIDFKNRQLKSENLFIHAGMFAYKRKSSSKSNSSSKTKTLPGDDKVTYHKVRSGDSLFAMSLKYNTSLDKICKLNEIKASKILKIGEMIKVR